MPEEMQDGELPFRSDFAARVLDEADIIAARRRRTRRTIAPMAAVAGIVAFAVWQMRPAEEAGPIPREVARADSGSMPGLRSARMEPLDFLFPEAAPLARFSDRFSGSGDAVEDDAVFFPEAEDDADGS